MSVNPYESPRTDPEPKERPTRVNRAATGCLLVLLMGPAMGIACGTVCTTIAGSRFPAVMSRIPEGVIGGLLALVGCIAVFQCVEAARKQTTTGVSYLIAALSL